MRYPEFLKENGTIGFVAPSMGCASEPYISTFDSAIAKFKHLGYAVLEGENCRLNKGVGISNTPVKCADELNKAYMSDESDILISCGGGELMCEVVPYIDFDAISQAKPKWYMGYSDNTNFTFLSAVIADTAAIYGPCVGAFGMETWHSSLKDSFDLLRGKKTTFTSYDRWESESLKNEENPFAVYNLTEKACMKAYNMEAGEFKGRLIGGCLDCLITLAGTSFDCVTDFCEKYKNDGIIWFLESCDLNAMSVRRALWQLENAGWFSNVKGFLIGRPGTFGNEILGMNHENAVMGILDKYNVPVIRNIDIGHCPPMLPIVCGSIAHVTFENNKLSITYSMED